MNINTTKLRGLGLLFGIALLTLASLDTPPFVWRIQRPLNDGIEK